MIWDVFISHAKEDKEDVARPLRNLLEEQGLRVWLDEAQLQLGDNLNQKIDEGLAQSSFGVVILSHAFFSKYWTKKELGGFLARESTGEKVILPIWHNIEFPEIVKYSPSLAEKYAISTVEGLDNVAEKILEVTGKPKQFLSKQIAGRYTSEFKFQFERLERSIEVIDSLSNEATWQHLANKRDVAKDDEWMGTDSSTLIECLYDLMTPLIAFRQSRYAIKRSLSVFKKKARLQFGLLDAALYAFTNESDIAAIEPKIIYTPRVPGWREKRQVNPSQYLWQGLEEERFDEAIPFFLTSNSNDKSIIPELVDIQDFREMYYKIYNGTDKKNQRAIGLLANALYDFQPLIRPVYWRLLVIWARIYHAVLDNNNFDLESNETDTLKNIFKPENSNVFPYNMKTNSKNFYESSEVTLRASTIYLETIVVPKLKLIISN